MDDRPTGIESGFKDVVLVVLVVLVVFVSLPVGQAVFLQQTESSFSIPL